MRYEREFSSKQNLKGRLSKDEDHKKLSGVCAGIAKHFELPRIVVRLATIGALIMLPVATGVAYVVASMLLPDSRYR
tara:strand:- start:3874 stop:4104 length:231 start_codon:yes stop_codon:yes gene_type:complete